MILVPESPFRTWIRLRLFLGSRACLLYTSNKIEVNGLTFSYEKRASSSRKNVLSGLNFTAEDGESIGLIGANGAGKSTLLKLMVGPVSYTHLRFSLS